MLFVTSALQRRKLPSQIQPKPDPITSCRGNTSVKTAGHRSSHSARGSFRIVGFSAGLPGAVEEFEKQVELDATREGEKVRSFSRLEWRDRGRRLVATNDEGVTYELKHVVRESPTLGAKPPEAR
jgi:hypothetical protein